jgi:hypothetical protein
MVAIQDLHEPGVHPLWETHMIFNLGPLDGNWRCFGIGNYCYGMRITH